MGLHKSWKEQAKSEYNIGKLHTDEIDRAGYEAYIAGAEDFQDRVLQMLQENYEAAKRDNEKEEDNAEIIETYEDLISIVNNLKTE